MKRESIDEKLPSKASIIGDGGSNDSSGRINEDQISQAYIERLFQKEEKLSEDSTLFPKRQESDTDPTGQNRKSVIQRLSKGQKSNSKKNSTRPSHK